MVVRTAYGVYTIASDANPIVSLLDMVVVVTLTRMVAEEGLHKHMGQDSVDLVEICRKGEQDGWKIAEMQLNVTRTEGDRWVMDEARRRMQAKRS